MTTVKFFSLAPSLVGRPPTLRELRAHLEGKGWMPARQEEVTGRIYMGIFLGGDQPVADGMVTLGWDTLALTTGWSYPVKVEENVEHAH